MTMRTHLEDDVLMDVLEGQAPAAAARHAAECASCAARVEEARAALFSVSGAEAPEPPPAFWTSFRARVREGIGAERASPRWRALVAPALLAAAATVAVVSLVPVSPSVEVAPVPVATLATAVPEDVAVETAAAPEDLVACPDVAACVVSLSDDESRALAEALRDELASGDL